MLEIEDVGRDQPVGGRQPALRHRPNDNPTRSDRNRASARRAASRAGTSRKTARPGGRAMLAAIASAIAATRGSTGMPVPRRRASRSSVMGRGLGRQLDERQRLSGPEVDRPPALGAEGLAVEDDVGAVAFDRDFVRFLEMHAAHMRAAELPARRRGEGARSSTMAAARSPAA